MMPDWHFWFSIAAISFQIGCIVWLWLLYRRIQHARRSMLDSHRALKSCWSKMKADTEALAIGRVMIHMRDEHGVVVELPGPERPTQH